MLPIFCVIALIFLSLENVSGCGTSLPDPKSWFQGPQIPGKSVNNKNTENVTCVQRYIDGGNQKKPIALHIMPIQGYVKITRFIIKVESFDNNTEIYCEKEKNTFQMDNRTVTAAIGTDKLVYNLSTPNIFYNRTVITATNESPIANDKRAILKYNATRVSFSCPEHISKTKYTQLGIINPSSNTIETITETTLNQKLNITHNGTILCCIYYVVNGTEERWITRHVTNKTLLVYDVDVQNGDNDKHRQEYVKRNEMSTDRINTSSTDDSPESNNTKPYVIGTTALAVVFILIAVIVIWKNRCRKKPKSDAKVLYAELDLLRQTAPETSQRARSGPEEESPYAQIIGEMRPK